MNIEDFINECISLVIKNKKETYKWNNSKITDFIEQFDEQKKIFFPFMIKEKLFKKYLFKLKKNYKKKFLKKKLK